MRSLKSFSVLTLLFCAALFAVSCGGAGAGDSADQSQEETHEHGDHDHADHSHDTATATAPTGAHGEGKEFTSAYVCPMHCKDSGSDEPGKCPACGMAYVAQADHAKDGHTH